MISHKYRTVFVHVPKTAGQSVETVFLHAEGLRWHKRESLLLRANRDPSLGPERLAHLYGAEYVEKGYLSQADFSSYYKFSIIRDPYARVLSEYRYRYAEKGVSLDQFLALSHDDAFSDPARHLASQAKYVTNASGQVIVDRLIRFEALDQEIREVWRRVFGAESPPVHWKVRLRPQALLSGLLHGRSGLPHVNKSVGGPRGAADLTKAQRALIEERYADDFRLLGYPIYADRPAGA